MISLTYIGSINLCVLCVSVVRSTPYLGGIYLRIHFTHQIQESPLPLIRVVIASISSRLFWGKSL
ncbi:Genome sequencing data, contig C319 (fragment) [Microcystis aeruginosa PCC 9443]|uniref:Genome sequencing data, contig C319 n=1 Tax=Microcystis aeruginosa PCC 9443 TaxID=1160281 RepID=I4GB79_MICAE